MKFYIARFRYAGGAFSHPWSLFAADMPAAMKRLAPGVDVDATEVIIRERPASEAVNLRDPEPNDAVLEHVDAVWDFG